RPTKLQMHVIAYIAQMWEAPVLHANDYIYFFRATNPSVKASAMVNEWETVKQFFSGNGQERYSAIAGLANVPENWLH
ncbi:hypothetical protein BGZ83_004355, partial [Gryganskiella cystojenkinii]